MVRKHTRPGKQTRIYRTGEGSASDLSVSSAGSWLDRLKSVLDKPVISIGTKNPSVTEDVHGAAPNGSLTPSVAEAPQEKPVQTSSSKARSSRQKPRRPVKAAKPKLKRVAPADVHIPTMGLPRLFYLFSSHVLKRPDWVPKPNEEETFKLKEDFLDKRLRFLSEYVQFTVSFINSKGGASKTTTAVYVGSIIAAVTNKVVLALPATRNTKTSTLARRAGVRRGNSPTIVNFGDMFQSGRDITYSSLSRLVSHSRFGLRIIPDDSVDVISPTGKITEAVIGGVVNAVKDNADVVILDTGNDDIDRQSIVMEAVLRSDIVVATATGDAPDTLESLWITLSQYMSDSRSRQKASKAIALFSRTGSKETPLDYIEYTKRRDEEGNVVGEIGFEGEVLLIPEDPFMSDKGNVAVDIDKISRDTRLAYKALAVAMYEAAAEAQAIDLPKMD